MLNAWKSHSIHIYFAWGCPCVCVCSYSRSMVWWDCQTPTHNLIWRRLPYIFNVLSIARPWIFPLKSVSAVPNHLTCVIRYPILLGTFASHNLPRPWYGSHIVWSFASRQYSMDWNWVYTIYNNGPNAIIIHILHSIHLCRVCFTCCIATM